MSMAEIPKKKLQLKETQLWKEALEDSRNHFLNKHTLNAHEDTMMDGFDLRTGYG